MALNTSELCFIPSSLDHTYLSDFWPQAAELLITTSVLSVPYRRNLPTPPVGEWALCVNASNLPSAECHEKDLLISLSGNTQTWLPDLSRKRGLILDLVGDFSSVHLRSTLSICLKLLFTLTTLRASSAHNIQQIWFTVQFQFTWSFEMSSFRISSDGSFTTLAAACRHSVWCAFFGVKWEVRNISQHSFRNGFHPLLLGDTVGLVKYVACHLFSVHAARVGANLCKHTSSNKANQKWDTVNKSWRLFTLSIKALTSKHNKAVKRDGMKHARVMIHHHNFLPALICLHTDKIHRVHDGSSEWATRGITVHSPNQAQNSSVRCIKWSIVKFWRQMDHSCNDCRRWRV